MTGVSGNGEKITLPDFGREIEAVILSEKAIEIVNLNRCQKLRTCK